MEQYDQLQSMGKTAEEKELENSKVDMDDSEAVRSRIQIMAQKGICTALVNLIKRGATTSTMEQLLICMMRMASEQSVRGKMIQAGCLSECIKISKMVRKLFLIRKHLIIIYFSKFIVEIAYRKRKLDNCRNRSKI